MRSSFDAICAVLDTYLDGLHFSDPERLSTVLHPQARYITATEEPHVNLSMAEYLPIVANRPSPAGRSEPRSGRIVSIELVGTTVAFARVDCSIGSRDFADALTLIFTDGRWSIISKVFHYTDRP